MVLCNCISAKDFKFPNVLSKYCINKNRDLIADEKLRQCLF